MNGFICIFLQEGFSDHKDRAPGIRSLLDLYTPLVSAEIFCIDIGVCNLIENTVIRLRFTCRIDYELVKLLAVIAR